MNTKCSTESHAFIFDNPQNNLNEILAALTGLDLSFIRNIKLFDLFKSQLNSS